MESDKCCPYFYTCHSFEFSSDHACSLYTDGECNHLSQDGSSYLNCARYEMNKPEQDKATEISEPNGSIFYVVKNDYCGRSRYTDKVGLDEPFITNHVKNWDSTPYDFKFWKKDVIACGTKEFCKSFIIKSGREAIFDYDEETQPDVFDGLTQSQTARIKQMILDFKKENEKTPYKRALESYINDSRAGNWTSPIDLSNKSSGFRAGAMWVKKEVSDYLTSLYAHTSKIKKDEIDNFLESLKIEEEKAIVVGVN